MNKEKLSKREFIKRLAFGVGGIATCSFPFNSHGAIKSFETKEDLWKWSIEAVYYEETAKGMLCTLCPNECIIKEDEPGDCRTRINHKSKLYSIAYGNPCAVHVDPIEKKPLLHFLPTTNAFSIATAGCNLACLNCQNWEISQKSPKETRNYDLMPPEIVKLAKEKKCKSIAYTYSEPIVFYEYTYNTSELAKAENIKNIIVSAGFINKAPLKKLCKVIDAANIDLKCFDEKTYLKLNGGKLQPVLDTLKILKEEGVWLEITNLIVPTWTDDLDMIKRMCEWLSNNGFNDYPLHFSRFHPMYKLTRLPVTPVETLNKAHKIAKEAGLKYVYIGNVPGHDSQNTFCPKCNKKIIERRGYYILSNHIEEGQCKFCGEKIAGVWE